MSSRAIRKAQRQHGEQPNSVDDDSDSPQSDVEEDAAAGARPNPFAILDANNNESEEEESSGRAAQDASVDSESGGNISKKPIGVTNVSTKNKKKKRNKKKNKVNTAAVGEANKPRDTGSHYSSQAVSSIDDIDSVLNSYSLTNQAHSDALSDNTDDSARLQLCALLLVDLQSLNAANEMRRLFGRAALGSVNDDQTEARAGRRRGQEGRRLDLAGALSGRNMPGGGLQGLSLRRNVFIPGKEEWPRGTAGGLGMEVVHKDQDGITEYRFVHSKSYQDVQSQFITCVESMDPDRMVQLLQFNPYHIATLLQVSDIAQHERDHATAGDLLERALFTFGRAVHSTFASTLSKGKARLDFRRPENREFWLAAWRYIGNLGMRGTWRTAHEWAKLLLCLDPEGDHYCMRLLIDQLALRSRQAQYLIDLVSSTHFQQSWSKLPNTRVSLALAQQQLSQQDACRRTLFSAIKDFPWLFNRLFQELGINKIPPSVWGSEARTEHEKLLSELYVVGAKDLWKTPEATALLIEVAGISQEMLPPGPVDQDPISMDEARHVMLTDDRRLIALLPPHITSRLHSALDPLTPPDNLPSYGSGGRLEPMEEPSSYAEQLMRLENMARRLNGGLIPTVDSVPPYYVPSDDDEGSEYSMT